MMNSKRINDQELIERIEDAVARSAASVQADYRPASPAALTAAEAAALIDHTLLKPEATAEQIRTLCAEADEHGFASVCVNPTWVPLCAELLSNSRSLVCTVVGFPLGATLTAAKVAETDLVIAAGAKEVDMVLNVGRLKDAEYMAVYEDVRAVVEAASVTGALVKVIFETCLLTTDEKIAASVICKTAGADFVKTSTGFNKGGATLADVNLMRRVVGDEMGVKAAGGVRTGEDAALMVAAGATRIGASAGIAIVAGMAGATDGATESEAGT